MEKLCPNRALFFLRNKYTAFTMGDTVALRSVNNFFPESYRSAAKQDNVHGVPVIGAIIDMSIIAPIEVYQKAYLHFAR